MEVLARLIRILDRNDEEIDVGMVDKSTFMLKNGNSIRIMEIAKPSNTVTCVTINKSTSVHDTSDDLAEYSAQIDTKSYEGDIDLEGNFGEVINDFIFDLE